MSPSIAEHAVGHDEDQAVRLAGAVAARARRASARTARSASTSACGIDLARRLRQPHAVDDRGVVELVGDDQVGLAGDRRDHAGVGREAGLERQDRLGVPLNVGEVRLQLLVERHRARRSSARRPSPRRTRATASSAASRRRGWWVRPEVVVRREADHPAVVDRHDRALRRRHDPQRPVQVPLAEGGELVVEERERVGCDAVVIGGRSSVAGQRCVQSRMTLPESPERAAANAASWSRNAEAVGDGGRDVQPGLEHHRHLVPGLVHLPAVDAPDA